ncbi:MAG: NDP-sugar synthase [Firmicutes bacterium]|jgi:NDP-sugar pyrophosphorylase family protein|nr:NDP-sugar synthase [Bacillota bacterium]HOB21940.1 NDP-sugar synthase [Bacillota bacterium]HQD39594.1 NDP-sugar synthase [Bacillota bacterium]
MRAMIMAAGVGSRLKPLTDLIPKPMVPIGNRPVMEHLVRHLARYGYREQIANLWYLPQKIRGHFESGGSFGVRLEYSPEQKLQGTAGGVRQARYFLEGGTFLVASGDGLTNIDLDAFLRFHREKGALASIALYPVADPSPFGVALLDEDSKIVGFQEKPPLHEAKSNLVNTGIYLFEPEIFSLIPETGTYDFGRELFPKLVEMDAPFYGFEMTGYWFDIGSIEAYKESCLDVVTGKIHLPLSTTELRCGVLVQGKVEIHPEAKIHGPALLGAGVRIERGAELYGPISIGPNSVVEAGAKLSSCVLWDSVKIGSGARCEDAILASKVQVGRGAQVEKGAVIAQGVQLGQGACVRENVKLAPELVLGAGQEVACDLLAEEDALCDFCG